MPLRKKRYLTYLTAIFPAQQLTQGAHNLHQLATSKGWNEQLQQKYKNTDQEATEIMLATERNCLPKSPTTRSWSLDLKKAGLKLRYWIQYKKIFKDTTKEL